jgi:prepilin-type N-terminal cleavage/methylation domain-containing protein
VAAVSRADAQRGATLVELLVAVALLSTVAVLSAQLVIQSTKLMDTAARASHNPDLVIATEWIRRDLYEAVSVVGGTMGWAGAPLVAMNQDGGWVAFAFVNGQLVRTNAPPGGGPTDNRVILDGVVGWRWSVDPGRAVRVELKTLVNPHAHQNLTGAAANRLERRTERLILALRGRPGGAAW